MLTLNISFDEWIGDSNMKNILLDTIYIALS